VLLHALKPDDPPKVVPLGGLEKMTVLESASADDVGLSKGLDVPVKLDPNAKDLTGEVQSREGEPETGRQ
jgi:hypothetical protein